MKIILYLTLLVISANTYAESITCLKPYTNKTKKSLILKCKNLNTFVSNNIGSDIYLVLAEPFLKNPASLFGHNFLLFTKNDPSKSISGFTLNFEAVDDSKNGVEYIYKGIFGKFKGRYNLKHFYNNIKLYNNFEDRDLSLYKLNFTEKEKYKLLLKAWEYGTNPPEIPYYFFTGNCAFYITDFLTKKIPSSNRPLIYYSPQNTLIDLKEKIIGNQIKLISAKKEIQLYSQKPDLLSKLYAKSKYQIYLKTRVHKAPKLKQSLLELNKYKIQSNQSLEKLNLSKTKNEIPYGFVSLASTSKNKVMISGSLVKNTYTSETGYSTLNLLSFTTNDFNQRESELTLIDMNSNLVFDNIFKDLSWAISAKHQRKESLNFISTNMKSNLGVSVNLLKQIFLTLKSNLIFDSRFIDVYPTLTLNSFHKDYQFSINLHKKYRVDHLKTSLSRTLINNHNISINYEDFKDHESRAYLAFDFKL